MKLIFRAFSAFLLLSFMSSSFILSNPPEVSAFTCPDGITTFPNASFSAECPGGAAGNQDPESSLPNLVVTSEDCDFENLSILGIPVWYKYLEGTKDTSIFEGQTASQSATDSAECRPVLSRDGNGFVDPASGLGIGLAAIEIMMTLAGLVAVGMIIWASFNYVLSQGESDKAASARKTVMNAAIGLIIIIVATRIVSFIATRLTS